MDLTIAERLMAMQTLPGKANFVELLVIDEARKALGFTSDELEEFGLKTEVKGDQMNTRWDEAHETTVRPIALSAVAVKILKKQLDDMDTKGELTLQHVSLFEKVHDNAPDHDTTAAGGTG